MADEIDRANEFVDNEVSWALNRLRQQNLKGAASAIGAEFCVECDEPIPEERKKLGFKFCVPCVEDRERRKALYAEG